MFPLLPRPFFVPSMFSGLADQRDNAGPATGVPRSECVIDFVSRAPRARQNDSTPAAFGTSRVLQRSFCECSGDERMRDKALPILSFVIVMPMVLLALLLAVSARLD